MGKTPDKKYNEKKTSIWQDPRFSHLVSDPRFKHLRKEARKVKIDKRFESMFHDEKFKIKYTVDKYGRKVNKTSSEDLKKYYEIDSSSSSSSSSDDENEEKERRQEEKEIAKVESSDDEIHLNDKLAAADDDADDDGAVLDDTIKSKLLDSKLDYARGEGRLMTDSSSDEESSADDDDELFIEHVWGELDKDAPRTDESTRRLASCNMDWDRIRASDIMVLCNSFLPAGASILSVTIYPSEFGKQRLAEEEIHGPPELVKGDEDDDDDDSKSTDSNDSELIQEQDSDAEEGDEYHMEKLRQYQLNRLKYYYAVIECDSVSTADRLYKECDGLEYESTATTLDLRFIPDEVSFDQDEPKEICTELPDLSKYKPRIFTTKALYQAKVDLTWDENSIERKEMNEKLSSGKLDDINDVELKKYVAYSSEEEDEDDDSGLKSNNKKKSDDNDDDGNSPSSEDDDDDKHTKISKYKSLLESINKKENESEKRKYEMEYSWGINVDDKVEKKLEVVKKQLTPIEKALEKKSEKNKRRKEERKKKKKNKGNADEDDEDEEYSSDDLPDGIDMSDPYFAEEFANGEFKPSKNRKNNKKSKKTNKTNEEDSEEEQEEERKAKELELLLDDGEDDGKEHFSLSKIQKSENETKSKKKRRKKLKKSKQEIEAAKSTVEDNFAVNVGDDRFGALYTSHLFNIDPTDSHYKKTKGMEKIIDEKFKRRHSNFGDGVKTNDDDDAEEPDNKRSKPHLENRLLVKNLKRKIQGNLSKV